MLGQFSLRDFDPDTFGFVAEFRRRFCLTLHLAFSQATKSGTKSIGLFLDLEQNIMYLDEKWRGVQQSLVNRAKMILHPCSDFWDHPRCRNVKDVMEAQRGFDRL